MAYYENRERSELGIVDAVETLTSIADLEFDSPIAIAESHEIELQEFPIIYRTVHWLHRRNAEKVMSVVRDTFRVILNYLKYFYKREHAKLAQQESVEGIKTIMVLVGEAAKKVDKHSQLFLGTTAESVKKTKEFRDLWAFYQRKIAPISISGSQGKWMGIVPQEIITKIQEKPQVLPKETVNHLFIDLDSIKKDDEYELFLIRKEDGSRFFNPRLLRNIKLICNFEDYFGDEEGVEAPPLNSLQVWKDLQSQFFARDILLHSWSVIDHFVKNAYKYRNNELAMIAYQAVVALMLSANRGSTMKEISKGPSKYLKDFQQLFRKILSSSDFHKLITYPPKNPESISYRVIQLVQHVCANVYSGSHMSLDMANFVNELILKGKTEGAYHESFTELSMLPLSGRLAFEYDALQCSMRHYGHMPLMTILETLQEGDVTGFDPILLQNLPSSLFDFYRKRKKISVLRIPSPCVQEHIHKAYIADEFKSFLQSMRGEDPTKELLLFNLQDRTSWKEFARCNALEELQKNDEFHKCLSVVSLTKDSDFYYQEGVYRDLNSAELFIEQFLEHMQSGNAGYFYPKKVKTAIFPSFAVKLAKAIHEIFFGGKNVLSRSNRCDFIELFYLFLQLKIIEVVHPTAVSFSCKDSIDIGMTASCEFFLLFKLINGRTLSEKEEEYMKVLLHVPAICYRGRVLLEERFTRFNSLVKLLEGPVWDRKAVKEQIGPLFEGDSLSTVIAIPH